MIKVSVFYPAGQESTFDLDYYLKQHLPMVQERLGADCLDAKVDHGLSGAAPGSPPAFAAVGHLFFSSVETFGASFGPHSDAILGDIVNFTNVEPVIQISDVVL